MPSRFLDELPEEHVEVTEAKGGFGNYGANYGASRFDTMQSFSSNYTTPGWQRAQARKGARQRIRGRGRRVRAGRSAVRRPTPERGRSPRGGEAPHAADDRG